MVVDRWRRRVLAGWSLLLELLEVLRPGVVILLAILFCRLPAGQQDLVIYLALGWASWRAWRWVRSPVDDGGPCPACHRDELDGEHERTVALAGFLEGLAGTRRFGFDDQERAALREAAEWLWPLVDRQGGEDR